MTTSTLLPQWLAPAQVFRRTFLAAEEHHTMQNSLARQKVSYVTAQCHSKWQRLRPILSAASIHMVLLFIYFNFHCWRTAWITFIGGLSPILSEVKTEKKAWTGQSCWDTSLTCQKVRWQFHTSHVDPIASEWECEITNQWFNWIHLCWRPIFRTLQINILNCIANFQMATVKWNVSFPVCLLITDKL